MNNLEHYWVFGALCVLVALFMLRLVLREHITLQGSLTFLLFLGAGAVVAIYPASLSWLTHRLGFELPSNFLFAACLAALAVLHVASLITISRVELRSIALTQEVALLQERLDRLAESEAKLEAVQSPQR